MSLPNTSTIESALVFALTTDTLESIADNVRATGAASVQLVIPNTVLVFQQPDAFAQLRQLLAGVASTLLVISGDEQVLDAARHNEFDTVGVQETRILAPGETAPGLVHSYATRPLADDDLEFLDALERVNFRDRYDDAPDDLPEPQSERLERGNRPQRSRVTRPIADEPTTIWDREVEDEEDPPHSTYVARPGRTVRRSAAATETRDQLVRSPRARSNERDAERLYPPRRSSALRVLLPLVLILLLIAAPLGYYFFTHATIGVTLPPNTANDVAFNGEVIALTQESTGPQTAVQAVQVSAPASFTLEVKAGQTLTPVGVARGTVMIYSTLGQAVDLPQGTEFIAKNTAGQEVHFLLDSPATIPPAVTSTTIAGTSTTNGRLQVAISASAPGSSSNVGENTITQLQIPNQQPINTGGSINLMNTPIAGGDEQNVSVVTNENVQNALGDALTGLYKTGIAELGKQLPNNFELDQETLNPNQETLGDAQSYDPPVVEPAIGQVLDANNATFRLTVKANFSALAVPHGLPVSTQLQRVVPAYFQAQPSSPCAAGQRQVGFTVTSWHWDGTRLSTDGAVTCQTSQQEQQVRSNVLQAVHGQSRAAADAALRQLQANGVIASYTIEPANRQQFSRLDLLTNVQITGTSSALPTSSTVPEQPSPLAIPSEQPTAGAQP